MTTTWTITQTNYETVTGFITTAHWNATAVDGDYTASVYSTCSFPETEGTMTPYTGVTEAQVLGWIWANGVDKDAAEAALAQNIADQKAPKVSTGTPWSA